MKDLGKRLNELASSATTGASLRDPSLIAPLARRSQRGLSMAMALVGVVAVAFMVFMWQGNDSGTTSVVAGQVEDEAATEFFDDESCSGESTLALLRAGIPTRDYEPAGSFDALANQSTAVVAGQIESIARTEVNGRSYIEVTVAGVSDVPFAAGVDTPRNDIKIIAYEAQWADSSSPDPLASPVAVERLDFFGFLSPWSGVRDGWAPGPEGLYVSCSGGGVPVMANAAGPNDPTNPGEWWAVKATQQAEGQAMADAAAPDALEAARLAAEAARLEAERAAAAAQAASMAASPPAEFFLHTVAVGDRLGSIAEQYNVTVDVIIRVNPQMDPNLIIAGEQLVIPTTESDIDLLERAGPGRPDGVIASYVIRPGDTLGSIANIWTVSLEALLASNPSIDQATLRVNQVLVIPPWGTGLDASELEPRVAPRQATLATPEELVELQAATIEIARSRWDISAVDSYVLRYAEFRPEGMATVVTVLVEGGEVVGADPVQFFDSGQGYTVEELFDIAGSAEGLREFEFGQTTGHPTVISVDPDTTVAGDEFAIRNIEVTPRSEFDDVDLRIRDWLPEPSGRIEPGRTGELVALYLLHEQPTHRAFLFVSGDEVCVDLKAVSDGAETGSGMGNCIQKNDFVTMPIELGDSTRQRGFPSLLLAVPPLNFADQGWTTEGEGGTLDVTAWSVLLTQDATTPVDQASVRIFCDCGALLLTHSGSP